MNEPKTLSPPASTGNDKVIGAIKALVEEVPGGGLAVELCSWFVRTPFERRTEDWQRQVGEALDELRSSHKVDLSALQDDDKFMDTVFQATQIALRTSVDEKKEALRNAVINAALQPSPDESDRHMFLQLIDRFTAWHLRLLAFFDDPVDWCARHNRSGPACSITSSLTIALETAFPELKGKQVFYEQVCIELDGAGLCNAARNLKTNMTATGWRASRNTERGRAFLKFISAR